jgi:hypothetical protein
MSKRNSNFSIYTHLRMLLRAIPMRNEATLRLAIAARIEADEASGEIFDRGDTSARAHLQDVANVPRETSLREAMATIRKLKLIEGERKYSKGQRKQGSDRLVLNWSQWEDACVPLSGIQALNLAKRDSTPTLSGTQGEPLSGTQHDKDTATSTATSTAFAKTPHGAPSSRRGSRKVADATSDGEPDAPEATPLPPSAVELPGQPDGVAWTELPPADWGWPIHQDSLGRVCFVFNAAGKKAYAELSKAGFASEDIVRAQQTCGPKLERVAKKGSAQTAALAMSVMLSYCRFAKEKREKNAKPRSSQIDYRQRDAILVGGRFNDV